LVREELSLLINDYYISNPPMSTQLVIFDIAGTTLLDNNHVATALQSAFSQFHLTISLEVANRVMGYPKPVAISMLLQSQFKQRHEASDPVVQSIHACFLDEMTRFYQTSPELQEKDEATKLFIFLRNQGIKVWLDTGFDRLTTNLIIHRLQWQSHLDGSVTSDEVNQGRPFPDLIYRAMELSHISDAKVVAKVGDTPADLQEGTGAGCGFVIGVTTGATPPSQLATFPHTHLVETLWDIPPILGL
jgi:phosphonatase-like hydrolase